MRKITKRKVLSVFLALTLLVGSMNVWISGQGSNQVNASDSNPTTEYTELSFHSFDVADDTYTTQQDRILTSLSKFDHVAFTGKFTFGQVGGSSPSTDNVIVIGGTASNKWAGIRIFLHTNGNLYVNNYLANVTVVGSNPICSLTPSEVEGIDSLVDEEIQIRMTFDYDATATDSVSVQVSFEVKGQTITKEAKTLTGAEAALTRTDGYGMLIKPNGSIEIASVVKEQEQEPEEYTELSFRSFEVADDTYTTQQDRILTSLSKFDHVAFTGKFTFGQVGGSSPSTDNVIVIGGTASDKWTGIRIFLHSNGNLYVNNYLTNVTVVGNNPICSLTPGEVEGIDTFVGEEIQIRMTFDYDATATDAVTVQVSFEVKGQTFTKEAKTLTGAEAALTRTDGYGMIIRPNGSIDIESVPADEVPEEYSELTFTSFGLHNGSQTGAATKNYQEHSITEWDGVAVSGYVTFDTSDAGSYLGFGVTSTTFVAIRYNTTGVLLGGAGMSVSEGNVYSGAEVAAGEKVYIRLTFDVDGTALKVTLKVKEAEAVSATYTIAQDAVYGMRVYTKTAADTIAYESIGTDTPDEPDTPDNPDVPETPGVSDTPQKALSEYEVITFSDMGIGDQTVQGRTANCTGAIQDLDGKVFQGMVTFPKESEGEIDGILTIGGVAANRWLGLRIGVTSAGAMYIRDASNGANRWNITPETMNVGTDAREKELKLSLTFTRVDANNVYVGVYVNDTFCGEKLFENLTKEFGSTLMVYSASAPIKVASIVMGLSDVPQKQLSEYKMLTFSDFGMKDQTVEGRTVNCNNTVQSLDGKMFQGKITFSTESSGTDGILTIGGNQANRWYGLRVGVMNTGQLYICEGANPAQRWNITPEAMGVGSDVRGQEIELGMTFTCADANNVYVGVYVNGTFCGEKLFKNLVHEFGNTLMVYSSSLPIQIAASETPWTKFLKSDVNFAYFGFTDKWDSELEAICK